MAWEDINLGPVTWHIQCTKNREEQVVPLSSEVVDILTRRMMRKTNDWVFASETSKSGHMEEPKSAWKRLLARAEIKDLGMSKQVCKLKRSRVQNNQREG